LVDLSEIHDNRWLVVFEGFPKNATHDGAKDGDDGIGDWVFGRLVSLAQSRVRVDFSLSFLRVITYIRSTVNPQRTILSSHDLGGFQCLNASG
jgi:hypothetical protein